MVRNYTKKTHRSVINEENVEAAVQEVLNKILSIRKAARKYDLKASTLQHRVENRRKDAEQNDAAPRSETYSTKYTTSQVFTREEERQLNHYIIKSSKMHYGLTLTQTRGLAHEYARKLNKKYPPSWDEKKLAGTDWLVGFRKRNTNISLRKPENTSAARSFAFNKTAVDQFYQNYETVLARHNFTADRIINMDETGITTVLNTPKVLAAKKQRQVGQVVSAERGELVTFCGIVSATGYALPPVYVFPRVHYKEHFLKGAPEGSLGLSSRSGWMNAPLYMDVLKHIQKHTSCSKENPILLLCDNHESHISIEAINFSRENGIVYLSFPPHTSHKLQPLDVSVFAPFKGKLKIAFNDWHLVNAGKTISIYNIAELSKLAFYECFTPKNIIGGFTKPGIWPFNKMAFGVEDYAPLEIFQSTSDTIVAEPQEETPHQDAEIESIPGYPARHMTPPPSTPAITPEAVRPFPKAQQKTSNRKGREKGKSRIFTDTPEKNRLQMIHDEKEQKRKNKEIREKAKQLKTAQNLLGLTTTNKKKKRRCESVSDSSSCESDLPVLADDSDMDVSDEVEDACDSEEIQEKTVSPPAVETLEIGDFLLIKFTKKKTVLYYVGKVVAKYEFSELEVSFLRKKPTAWVFVYPNALDSAAVDISDVVLKLPSPCFTKGTNRSASFFTFPFDLSCYNVK